MGKPAIIAGGEEDVSVIKLQQHMKRLIFVVWHISSVCADCIFCKGCSINRINRVFRWVVLRTEKAVCKKNKKFLVVKFV